MTNLVYLSAVELLALFRARQVSPVELMKALIDRADTVEPKVNAFSERLFEEALVQAQEAEARYMGTGHPPRPLEGIPVATKDEQPIAGHRSSDGSLVFKDEVAEISHPIIERIRNAGGIIHARTTTPEFCCAGFTHTKLWGVTCNPWNLDYSPGGSSGGSAAALAAGTTTLATGSDIGGSIRIPASFSGVVGFKPPYGRVPAIPPWNLDHYCHDGPLARTVADCVLLENVIAGPHPMDVVSLRPKLELPEVFEDIKGLRIALSIHLGDYRVDSEVAANTYAVADAFREAGAQVEEVSFSWKREEIFTASMIHFGSIFGAALSEVVQTHEDLVMPYSRDFVQQSEKVLKDRTFYEGLDYEGYLYMELGTVLEDYDALICPTTAIPALLAGEDYVDTAPMVDDVPVDSAFEIMMTIPFNIASRCPVLSVPSGRAKNGVPTGVQIVGKTYDDVKVFQIAAALEQVRPWFTDPSWRPKI